MHPRLPGIGVEAAALTVEQFWARGVDIGIDEVDLIKLDCEGAEYFNISSPPTKRAGTLRRTVRIQGCTTIPEERHMECAHYFDHCRRCRLSMEIGPIFGIRNLSDLSCHWPC